MPRWTVDARATQEMNLAIIQQKAKAFVKYPASLTVFNGYPMYTNGIEEAIYMIKYFTQMQMELELITEYADDMKQLYVDLLKYHRGQGGGTTTWGQLMLRMEKVFEVDPRLSRT